MPQVGLFELVSTGWALASALGIGALGAFSLSGGRSRSRGALPFGLFAITWALQIAAINVAGHLTEGLAGPVYLLAAGMLLLMPYLLVEFSAAYAGSPSRDAPWRWFRYGAAAVALVGAGVLVLAPELLLEGTATAGAVVFPVWGPLELPLIGVPRLLAFAIALVSLNHAVQDAPTERTKNRIGTLLGGLALYVAYIAARSTVGFGLVLAGGLDARAGLFTIGFLGLSLLCLALGLRALRNASREPSAAGIRRERWLAAAFLVPLLAGGLERAALHAVEATIPLRTVGLWRLAGVGVIAYGLARWRIYDLPERVRRATSTATGATGALASGATAYGAGTVLLSGTIVPALGALAVTGMTLVPGVRLAKRLLGPSKPENPVEQDEEAFSKKIEAYRAAVEASMARGTLDEDERFLEGLRERFGIEPGQARVVRHYARETIVPMQAGDPDEAYERLRILGKGGAGRTWLARDRARDRLVVLKEPLEHWQKNPKMLEAARREAELAAKVRHPNVVEVEEVVETDEHPVLVMEHVPGGSLADRLGREGVLGPRQALRWAHDVATGLAAVHEAGIVHRDLKPSNVLLTDEGTAKITDFGIARETADEGGTRVVEDDETPLGTEAYMAPEVRSGRSTGDERSDVYGCASLLYTCLHGSPPSDGGPIVVEQEIPTELEQVLAKGLAVNPEDRYPSARALADALAEVPTA